MAFGEDLKGELFNRIGAQDSSNPMQMLEQGRKEKSEGNQAKAKEIFQGIINNSQTKAAQLAEQKQHRAAAEEFYFVYLAQKELENESEKNEMFTKVIESLEGASKTAIDFGEDNRGITILTLAGMIAILNNNTEQAHQIYNKGLEISNQKPNSKALQKLLYSLGYLLDALKNINMGALTEAQGFISHDLKPMLKTAKMTTFDHLLDSIVTDVGNIIGGQVKMPRIEVMNEAPKDLVFNQAYEISIAIENTGEGDATDFNLELNFPEDLELLSGNLKENYGTLKPNDKKDHKLSFRLLTSTADEVQKEISGTITYTDMLGNGRKQFISPFDLVFRSTSKSSEYEKRLKEVSEGMMTDESKGEFVPSGLVTSVTNLHENVKSHVTEALSNEDFNSVETGMKILEAIGNWSQGVLSDSDAVFKTGVETMLEVRENKVRSEMEEHFKVETEKLIEQHNQSVKELDEKFEREKQEEVDRTTTSLTMKHNAEISKIKTDHEDDLQRVNKTVENKFKIQFAQQEEKIRAEAQAELQKKNNEIENGVRQVQEQYAADKDKELAQLRDELTKKYETQISSLKSQFETEKNRISAYAEEEKESALKSLQSKLNQEKQTEIQNLERDMKAKSDHVLSETTGDLTSKHTKELQARDQKIRELEEKITILEGKLNQ